VARVPESEAEGTFVAHVVVSDPDEGRNGRFDCTLSADSSTAENSFRLMTVGEGEYQLLTAALLDRELGDRYRLTVVCEDGGQPALVSSAQLLVQVCIIIIIIIIIINNNKLSCCRETARRLVLFRIITKAKMEKAYILCMFRVL